MRWIDLLRPVMRLSPRQSIRLLGLLGAGWADDAKWRSVQPRYRAYVDPVLKCLATVDLAEWGGRSCYYWGRFPDVAHQLLLCRVLKPGDTYIDVGANVGFHSMLASRLVGPSGVVLSFEPNPATFSILSGHMAINRIKNCRPFSFALGDVDGDATLNQIEIHSGTATLRAVNEPLNSVKVNVRRGDEIFKDIPFAGQTIIKVDVEGFELQVLRGLEKTLARVAIVAVEITPDWLAQQKATPGEMVTYMQNLGFQAIVPRLTWRLGLFSPRLEFDPLTRITKQTDVCFVRDTTNYLLPAHARA